MCSSTSPALGLAVLALAAAGCRDRGLVPARTCPAPRAPDLTLSLGAWGNVAGTASEAWVIASYHPPGPFAAPKLLRWDGCDWQPAPSPLDDGRVNTPTSLWSDGRDVWLAGTNTAVTEGMEVFGPRGHIYRQGGGQSYCKDGHLFRRRGDAWEEVKRPEQSHRAQFAIAGKDADDLWMLERSCAPYDSGVKQEGVTLLHWNGRSLEKVAIDAAAIGEPASIWPEGGGAIWLGGSTGAGHWDGRAWRWFPFGTEDGARVIAGGRASDLWALGKHARHWDGNRWSDAGPPPAPADPYRAHWFGWAGAVARGHTFLTDYSGGIYRADGAKLALIARSRPTVDWPGSTTYAGNTLVAAGEELWLFDLDTAARPALRWRAGVWEVSPTTKEAPPAGDDVVALWNDGAGVVWAAVSARIALGGRAGEIRRHDGHAWTKVTDLDGFPFRFAGTAPDDVWLVGLNGRSWHFDGKSWRAVPTGTIDHLFAVWPARRDDVWAAGTGGTLLNWNGQEWRRWSTLGATDETAVKALGGAGAADIWAAGGGKRCVVHWNGSGWAAPERGDYLVSSWGSYCNVLDVWIGGGGAAGWLVGTESLPEDRSSGTGRMIQKPILLHWDGDAWTRPTDPWEVTAGDTYLTAIAGADAADVWAVGTAGRVIHWDGKDWTRVDIPTEENLHAVSVQKGGAVWVGGTRGALLRVR